MKLFPENISTFGAEIDNLFYLTLVFVAIAFVISVFVLFYPLIKYRYRKGQKAQYIQGIGWKQMRWIIIPMILLGLSDFTILITEHDTWNKIESTLPEGDVHVSVTGRQWNWIFRYPGPDNKLYTGDDVIVDEQNSELHVPVNKDIIFDLKARDVLHSFFIPATRLKQDVIPGRTIKRWVNITKEGKYDIACAEICGVLHSQMRNFIVVESQEKYEEFLKTLYSKETASK